MSLWTTFAGNACIVRFQMSAAVFQWAACTIVGYLVVSASTYSDQAVVTVQVCYYRDKQSINKFRIIKATKAGVTLTEPFALETKWHYKVCGL